MNPYDFVRIDWLRPPKREKPFWHHRLAGQGIQLYSGYLEIDITVEKPIFIPAYADQNRPVDPRVAQRFLQNKRGEYIIPGSSLKGMLRTVVEALGSGCLTLYSGRYESDTLDYRGKIDPKFRRCSQNTALCVACRIFGMMRERGSAHNGDERGNDMFLGKVNIGDAIGYADGVFPFEKPIYTKPLMEPKPHHASFYLDQSDQHIAGRKFFFHHSPDSALETASGIIKMGGRNANRYILPLNIETEFHFRLDFVNLTEDEFGALLLAIVLEKDIRHKIGYGKPLGLGSILLTPTSLTLVNYAARYRQPAMQNDMRELIGDDMWDEINTYIDQFTKTQLVPIAMDDLRRIWRWPPAPGVNYYYPSKYDWFDKPESIGKRIADTTTVPKQE